MRMFDGVRSKLTQSAIIVKEKLRLKTGELHEEFASETILKQQQEITRLQKEVASMIKYPPTPDGVPVLTEGDILFAYRGIIKETFLAVGMLEGTDKNLTPCFMNTYMHAIRSVISFFHLLPASEYHHHNEVGGLLRHSLDVALMTLRMSKGSRPLAIGFQDEEMLREPRWRFAAWLTGLLHDAGKVISDMRVSGKELDTTWNPQIETIYEFSERYGIDRYTVSWNPRRANHYHEKLSVLLLDRVLSDTAKRWLYQSNDNLSGPIIDALQNYARKEGYIEKPLRRADALSAERDRRTQFHKLIGQRKAGKSHGIISAIRDLRKNRWNKVNEIGARMYVIDGEVYLDYRNGVQDIISHMNANSSNSGHLARIESNIGIVVQEMEELGIVEPMHEESDFVRLTFTAKQGKMRQVDIVRISYPDLVFEGELRPPNLKDCYIEFSSMGERLTIDAKGSLDYTEPKDNPFQTLYNLDPEQGSQVNRNKARSLNLPGLPKPPEELMQAAENQSPTTTPQQINAPAPANTSNDGKPATATPAQNNVPAQKPAPKPQAPKPQATKKPATKKAATKTNTTKANSPSKTRGPTIVFENETNQSVEENNAAPSVWDGMNINAADDKPVQAPSSKPLATAAKGRKSQTQKAPQRASALKNVSDKDLRTLCYVMAWALSNGRTDGDSIVSYSSRNAIYAHKTWVLCLVEMTNMEMNTMAFFDRFGDDIEPGKVLGIDATEHIKLDSSCVKAFAELFGVGEKLFLDQIKNFNDYGRPERMDNLDFFAGKLTINSEQEKLILDSNLAKELNLIANGVASDV
ncbi:MobH family relaxase [Vibrio sp. 10N.247.311.12]|uniref:MobH family relaxase n=1 Tax=unclassified Vibrio TaxID=2614977 RepID=UPI00354CDE00